MIIYHIHFKKQGDYKMSEKLDTSYLAEIIRALKQLGGAGSLKEINSVIKQNGTMPYIKSNHNWERNVSATIQRHCKSTRSYKGAEDIFYSVYGLGEGFWGLREQKESISISVVNPIEQRQIDSVVNNSLLSSTEKEAIILSRRGQGEFRRKIIQRYKTCIITGISDTRLLVASHIKPWRNATNSERLSSENGFLLSPLYDKLFDLGLITFKANGNIVISPQLLDNDKKLINIDEHRSYVKVLSKELKENIEYHNDVIFLR